MQKPSDELLIAYLDGEVDAETAAELRAALARDPALAAEAEALRESAAALRLAFDDVLHESVPERLIAAARGATPVEKVVRFPEARTQKEAPARRRWTGWAALPMAASLAGLLVGGGLGYVIATSREPVQVAQTQPPQPSPVQQASSTSSNWIGNIAGYHRMLVNAGSDDAGLVDVPADPNGSGARKITQQLPPDFRMPNLKAWGLVFQGARFLFIDGRPGTQLFYTTDNKSLGPVTVVVAVTTQGDAAPAFSREGDLNVIHWRHQGHAYAIVGSADMGYLWNIHNDLAWQLNAI